MSETKPAGRAKLPFKAMPVQVYYPVDDVEQLDKIAAEEGVDRSILLRRIARLFLRSYAAETPHCGTCAAERR